LSERPIEIDKEQFAKLEKAHSKLIDSAATVEKLATQYGELVGHVSRFAPSVIDERENRVSFEIEPTTYFDRPKELSMRGNYLVVIDLKNQEVVSLRVHQIIRKDAAADLMGGLSSPLPAKRDVGGILTKAALVAEPLLALDTNTMDIRVANFVIEPQSPIIVPYAEKLSMVLGIPSDGLSLGALAVGDEPLFFGENANTVTKIRIPFRALYQHMLILGTTGSGKTTFLKNLAYEMLSSNKHSIPADLCLLLFDIAGDYTQVICQARPEGEKSAVEQNTRLTEALYGKVNPPEQVTIIAPITKQFIQTRFGDKQPQLEEIAKAYFDSAIRPIAEKFAGGYELLTCTATGNTAIVDIKIGGRKVSIRLFPYAFSFLAVQNQLGEISPYFSEQGRRLLPKLVEKLEQLDQRKFDTLQSLTESLRTKNSQTLGGQTKIHYQTIENIYRTLEMLNSSGLFDVKLGGAAISEPEVSNLFEKKGLVIFDVYFMDTPVEVKGDAENVVTLRLLDRVFKWKMDAYRSKVEVPPTIMIIDEAHRFFPARRREGYGEQAEYSDLVSKKITNIARLGRARQLGLIFATHSPEDVHPIILQLTNTKVFFRLDQAIIGRLDIPRELQSQVTRIADRTAIAKSHVFRLGYTVLKTPMPVLGHFDLSAT
jgi:DNA helicase HerA-like ATPase